jgi:hypothetical protein
LLAVVACVAHSAWADWPSDPNVNLPICTASGDQTHPIMVSDGSGGAIIAWTDSRNGSSNLDIYAQRVSIAGSVLWTTNGIPVCAASGNQINPTMIPDGAGGVFIAWEDHRSGQADIYAQRLNTAGVPLWAGNGVVLCAAPNDQTYPTLCSDGAGGAIVTWWDLRTESDIYAQRVNGAGLAQWTPDGVPVCTTSGLQAYPTIVPDGSGGAVIAWQDLRSGDQDIYAQRLNSAGALQWAADGVGICIIAGDQRNPTLVSDGAGGAVITWPDKRLGSYTNSASIYTQRVSGTGLPLWAPNDGTNLDVSVCGPVTQGPVLCSDGAGGAIFAWADIRSISNYHIYAQWVNGAGLPQWSDSGVPVCLAPNTQSAPVIVADGAGGVIISWSDLRGGTYSDTYAQRMNAAGVAQWTANGVALSTAVNNQFLATIAPDGGGGAIVAWEDFRNGTDADIYAQNVKGNGTLGGSLLGVPNQLAHVGFALGRVEPNPSVGDLRVAFTLPVDAPAMLELYDIGGRRVESIAVDGLGPGDHVTSLDLRRSLLPPGLYALTLTQGSRHASTKAVILR